MSITGLDVKKELVRIFKREFTARNVNMQVLTSDPRTHEEIPSLCINRINGDEGQMGFNNLLTEEITGVGANATDTMVYTGLITETIEIRLWTENANERDDMMYLMQEIALLAKQELIKKNLGNMRITGIRDEQDFKTFEPYFIYWGVMNFIALNQLDVRPLVPPTTGVIESVDGTNAMDGVEQTEEELGGV